MYFINLDFKMSHRLRVRMGVVSHSQNCTGLLRPSKCVKKLIKERIESPRHAHKFVISIARNNKNITVKVSTEKNTNLKTADAIAPRGKHG